jgi:FKBP-type peptidyl-prolyl cis-trans isomerase
MAPLQSLILSCFLSGAALGFMPIQSSTRSTSRLFSTVLPEGLQKTVSKEGTGPAVKLGDIATVKYSCYLPDSAPFARSDSQKVVRSQLGWIDM